MQETRQQHEYDDPIIPPHKAGLQNAYGMALTLLVGGGMVIVLNYRQIQRWKRRLRKRKEDPSTHAKEG